MAPAKDLYIALRDDPNLEVPEGDTRESAAWKETAQRTRQHRTNAKALGMASEVKEDSAIAKFADFLEKAPTSDNKVRELLRQFQPPISSDRDTHYSGRQKAFDKVISTFIKNNNITTAKYNNLTKNLGEHFSEDSPFGDAFVDHLHDLEFGKEGEQQNFLKQLLEPKPFTADASMKDDLMELGYIDSKRGTGKLKLTPEGAAHLVLGGNRPSKSSDRFNVSNKNKLTNVKGSSVDSDHINISARSPKMSFGQRKTFAVNELSGTNKVASKKYAKALIDQFNPEKRSELDTALDKIEAYQDRVGSPLSGQQKNSHNANLQQIIDNNVSADDIYDDYSFETPVGDISDSTVAAESAAEAPEEKFKPIKIFNEGTFGADDFTPDGKLKPELFDKGADLGHLLSAEKEHLQGKTFESGKDYKAGTEIGETVKAKAAPKAKKKPATTPATPAATKPAEEKPAKATKPAGEKPAKEKNTEKPDATEEAAKLPQAEANSIMDVLDGHHNTDNAGKTTTSGTAFNELKEKMQGRLLRGELTQDDIKDISEHLSKFPVDTTVVSQSGSVTSKQAFDVLRAGAAEPPPPTPPDKPVGEGEGVGDGDKPTSSEPPTPANTGTGDTGVDAAKAKSDEQIAREDKVSAIIDHHSDGIKAAYEKEHGPVEENTDENAYSFEDHKAQLLRANSVSDAAVDKYKQTASKQSNTARVAAKTAETAAKNAKETADTKAKNKAKKDGVTELHQKLREAGHKGSKSDAAALYDTHKGDIDAAVKQKDDDKEKQEAAVEAANTLPDGVDSPDAIKQSLFGDANPTGLLAGSLPTRSENKHGTKANQMARDLLIHAQTHQDNLSTKTKKAIVDHLAILTNPESNIKGFKANKGEKFADLNHVANQIKQAVDDDIDVNSPEAQQTFQSQDIKLQEERQNFSAKHLDGISDSYAVESPAAAAKTVGRAAGKVAGKVAGAVKRGEARMAGADEEKDHKSESHARIWDHGTPNHTESFDGEGNSKGRSKFDHSKGESVSHEDVDSIHHSPVKEHHGTLTAKQEESMSKLRQAHKDGDSDAIEEHRSDLKDSGLSRSDFEHHEDDMPKSGPPDKEVAIYMQGQGYEWHEDTRRWRHKETDDNYRKSNGATKGTFASGAHSETGAHGYMATAEMGADGKVSATPDTGNYAVTPAGTHGVSSDLGGSPPTSAQGVQGHVLGHALTNAGVSHDGTSKSFPMSHLNGTGIHDSKHYDKPSGVKAAAKRGAGAAYRAATGGGAKAYMDRTKKNWSSPLVSSSSPLSQTLGRAGKIGAGLVRDVFGKSDVSELTAVELLQYHVALQKAEEKTNLRV